MLPSKFSNIRTTQFTHPPSVQSISEFRGGSTTVTKGVQRTEILVPNIGLLFQPKKSEHHKSLYQCISDQIMIVFVEQPLTMRV